MSRVVLPGNPTDQIISQARAQDAHWSQIHVNTAIHCLGYLTHPLDTPENIHKKAELAVDYADALLRAYGASFNRPGAKPKPEPRQPDPPGVVTSRAEGRDEVYVDRIRRDMLKTYTQWNGVPEDTKILKQVMLMIVNHHTVQAEGPDQTP